jgi:hypothetical protein
MFFIVESPVWMANPFTIAHRARHARIIVAEKRAGGLDGRQAHAKAASHADDSRQG